MDNTEDKLSVSTFKFKTEIHDMTETPEEIADHIMAYQERLDTQFDAIVNENKLKIAKKREREESRLKARMAEIEIERANHSTPDYVFSELFRKNPYTCARYLKTLDAETIKRELLYPIRAKPDHWQSILGYHIEAATELIERELERRRTNEKHGILDKLKSALKNTPENTAELGDSQ